MRLGTFTKTSVDNLRFEVDYSEWLEAPEVLLAFELGSDPADLMISSASILNTTSLVFFVGGGVDGEVYNMLVTISTSGGQVRRDYIVFTVHDP